MNWLRTIAAALAAGISIGLCSESIALAQEYVPPPVGIPGRRRGAGTRNPAACVAQEPALTALLPDNSYGQTIDATPTWFWHLPQTNAAIEFILLDRDGNSIYQTLLTAPSEAQIVSFTLPETAQLEANTDYHWYFSIVCNPDDRSQDIYTEGWIRHVQPSRDLVQLLDSPQADRASLFAENGLWYDAIATLAAEQRTAMPTDASSWRSLLDSVGLGELVDVPLSEADLPRTDTSP